MAAPLGEWPIFEPRGHLTNTEGGARILYARGSVPQGELELSIDSGKFKLQCHGWHSVYQTEVPHAQDFLQNWPIIPPGSIPQVTATGPEASVPPPWGAYQWHTDTPSWIYHPVTRTYLYYYTGRPGDLEDRAILQPPSNAFNQAYNTIQVAARATPPEMNSPWVQNDDWIVAVPEEPWEEPYWRNWPTNTQARGGCSEPGPVFVPLTHPTMGWAGFVRLFGRTQIVPNPPLPNGSWSWVMWYMDSPDGVTNWTNRVVYQDPRHPSEGGLAGDDPNTNFLYGHAQGLIPGAASGRYRGAWQASHILDLRAGGFHMVYMTGNPNVQGSAGFGHAFSNDLLNPTVDTWERNPNTPINPGSHPLLPDVTSNMKAPTLVIDEDFPAHAGEEGERYIAVTTGQTPVSTNSGTKSYVLIARRPKPAANPPTVIGDVRLENYASAQRDSVHTCRISLPDQPFWDLPNTPSTPFVVTVKAEGGSIPDQRVQARVVGPRHPSGNAKYLEVVLRDVMPSGQTTGYEDYQYYQAKTITLTTESVPGVPFTQHAEVDMSQVDLRVRIPDPESPGNTVDVVFDLDNATLIDFEASQQGNEIRKRYRAFARHIPADNSFPSLGFTFVYEIYSELRQVRWWLWATNSRVPAQGQYNWTQTQYTLTDDVVVLCTGPARFHVHYQDVMMTENVTYSPPDNYSAKMLTAAQENRFHDAQERALFGVMLFENGATGLEADTMIAEAEHLPEMQWQHWKQYGWGPMQICHRIPENSLINGDPETARRQAAKQSVADLVWFANARRNWIFALHSHSPATGVTGTSNEFAVTRGTHMASSGIADVRALRLSAYQEGMRWHHFIDENGELVHPADRNANSGQWSDSYWWNGRPFFGNNPSHPVNVVPSFSDDLGKRQMNWAEWEAPVAAYPSGALPRGCVGYDNQHWGGLWLAAFALMTNDPYAIHLCEANANSTLGQLWPVYDDRESGGGGPGGTGGTGGTSQITGLHESRADGRMALVACAMYWVTGDPWIPQNLINRMSNLIDTEPPEPSLRGRRVGWLGRPLDRESVRIYRKDDVNSSQSPRGQSVNCWQQGINLQALWACYLVTLDIRYLGIAQEVAYALTNYSSRKGPSSSNKWQLASSHIYNPYGTDAEPILPADKEDGVRSPLHPIPGATEPNPTEYLYAWWYGGGQETWVRIAAVLGYEFAVAESNEVWRTLCAEIIRDFVPSEEQAKGTYGWGSRYAINIYDDLAAVSDVWKDRPVTSSNRGGGTGEVGGPLGEGAATVANPPPTPVSGAGAGTIGGQEAVGLGTVEAPAATAAGTGSVGAAIGQGQATAVVAGDITGGGTGTVGGQIGKGQAYTTVPAGAPREYVAR